MEIKLKVGGMHCQSCAKSIKEAFAVIPGVKETVVDLDENSVIVQVDSGVEGNILKSKVEELGFDVL